MSIVLQQMIDIPTPATVMVWSLTVLAHSNDELSWPCISVGSLLDCLGSGTPTSILGVYILYVPIVGGSKAMCENYASGNGGGGTRFSSKVSMGISASTCLFSNLATAKCISWTVGKSRLISSWDCCWSSLGLNYSSLRACYSSHST